MEFFLLALIVSVIGAAPLAVYQRFGTAILVGICETIVIWVIYYLAVPSLVWPWWGAAGVTVLFLWFVNAVINSWIADTQSEPHKGGWAFPVALMVLMFLSCFRGWTALRDDDYAAMLGKVEERKWTQDVQPKDPKHIRMASIENALQLARQTLGQMGAIGSQFSVADSNFVAPQLINGKFKIIVPIDFRGWLTWRATKRIPGYIVIDGEDPTVPGEFVKLPENEQFVYSPNACWEYRLDRHLWYNGYAAKGLTLYSLEIDERGKPWWVVTVFEPTIFTSGEKVLGVVLVDPVTGKSEFQKQGEIEEWVDMVIPKDYMENYISWHGKYQNGWLNSWTGKTAVTEAEDPIMVFGSDGLPYWVTGLTSDNGKDMSLIGLYYTQTRTGHTVFYQADGSIDTMILDAIAKHGQVQFRHLHGAVPQIYNIYGTMAAVAPLLNEKHLFSGVAIVNVREIQQIAIGNDQYEAFRNYQNILSLSGKQIAPDLTRVLSRLTGAVDRISTIEQNGTVTFFIKLEGIPHVFTAGMGILPSPAKLPITKPGDTVVVEFYASGESSEPLRTFENLSILLETTVAEEEVKAAASERKAAETK